MSQGDKSGLYGGLMKAHTLVGVQRCGLLLLDETGCCHGEISQMVGVRPSLCALLA